VELVSTQLQKDAGRHRKKLHGSLKQCPVKHYQKIDKYKRKYRGNYSEKKIKTKQKKMMTCYFYQRNKFRR
jgi:gamma-glutamylcyclotransferase (GGCT)/AIG2-like uncharacterized protein YtfP